MQETEATEPKILSVMNFFIEPGRLTKGLREMWGPMGEGLGKSFTTIRLGEKWGHKLKPKDLVLISMSQDQNQPVIIGTGLVEAILIVPLDSLAFLPEKYRPFTAKNVGAKTFAEIWKDLEEANGRQIILDETVSIVQMLSVNPDGKRFRMPST